MNLKRFIDARIRHALRLDAATQNVEVTAKKLKRSRIKLANDVAKKSEQAAIAAKSQGMSKAKKLGIIGAALAAASAAAYMLYKKFSGGARRFDPSADADNFEHVGGAEGVDAYKNIKKEVDSVFNDIKEQVKNLKNLKNEVIDVDYKVKDSRYW